MPAHVHDLWGLVLDRQYVDPRELADAVESQAPEGSLDFRTRLLIRDSVEALRGYWGDKRFAEWLTNCRSKDRVEAIRGEDLGRPGFPFLPDQLKEQGEGH